MPDAATEIMWVKLRLKAVEIFQEPTGGRNPWQGESIMF
jgi:hypothetical protein